MGEGELMEVLRSHEIVADREPTAEEIAVRVLWAYQDAVLIECAAPAGAAAAMAHPNPPSGFSTAYVLAGSYRATVGTGGSASGAAHVETVAAGGFNHDDRETWPAGAPVTYEAHAGTRWRCFHQSWLAPSRAVQSVHGAPATIALPAGGLLAVIGGETNAADGTFVLRTDESATVTLTRGWAWLTAPAA